MSSFGRQQSLQDVPAVYRMIDTDSAAERHYQALVGRFVELLSDLSQEHQLAEVRERLEPLKSSITRLFPDLVMTNLGSPLSEGSFFFDKGGVQGFRYDNLSSGEKAAFDLLLDLYVVREDFARGLICLDEPETHLNPRVQAQLLDEVLVATDPNCQVWLASHSIGMLRRAMQLRAERGDEVVFLDFEDHDFDQSVVLQPRALDRVFWKRVARVALDDLAELIAPTTIYLCEGVPASPDAERQVAWDARILRTIFLPRFPDIEFVSVGGKSQLAEVADGFATAVAPGSALVRVRDRDDLTDSRREAMLSEDPNLRILRHRSLESYLISDDVLEAMVSEFGKREEDALPALKAARDTALHEAAKDDNSKPALGVVFQKARLVLDRNGQLGENKFQFAVDVLAPLVKPGMTSYDELRTDLAI